MLGFSLAIVALYLVAHLLSGWSWLADTFNLSTTMLSLTGVNIIYLTIPYWRLARYSLPFATLVSSMIFSIIELGGLSQTDPRHGAYLYVAMALVNVFMGGLYGLPFLSGAIFLAYVYVTLQSHFDYASMSSVSVVLLGSSIILTVIAYFFWKGKFISLEAQKVTQLSGQLKSNQQQSAILIQSIADGIIVINTEDKITLMNPAAAAMTEWPVNEALGVDATLVARLAKENGEEIKSDENPLSAVLKSQTRTNQTLQLTGRNGKKQVISLVVSPVITSAGVAPVGVVAVMRDISEQRAVEQQRAEFISTAAHEMRTPVAAIEGYLALTLNDKVSTIDSRARGYLEKAHISTEHLGKLFQDLLTSSKAEDGRLSNHPAVVEMGTFMQHLTDDLKFAAEKKGLFAEFLVGASDTTIDATAKDAGTTHMVKPLYYTYADPDRIREVITNLFDNAVKYTEQGKISIGLTGDNNVVQVYVRDTGPGIPAEDIPHLFQKFYRVDNSATRTIGGTGLGLFICRKIVELYHGRVWVESELGKGSTFFINLPRLTTQRATELQAAEATQTTQAI